MTKMYLDLANEGIKQGNKAKSLINHALRRSKLKKNRNQRFALRDYKTLEVISVVKNGRVLKTTGHGRLTNPEFNKLKEHYFNA